MSDQATYTCVAKNSQSYTVKGNLELQVMGKSNDFSILPTFLHTENKIVFLENPSKKVLTTSYEERFYYFPTRYIG